MCYQRISVSLFLTQDDKTDLDFLQFEAHQILHLLLWLQKLLHQRI